MLLFNFNAKMKSFLPLEQNVSSFQINNAELTGGEEKGAVLVMVLVDHQTDHTELTGATLTASLKILADAALSHP